MKIDILKKTLTEAPIIKKGNYDYIIHPITDGVPYITAALLKEVTTAMHKQIESCGHIDRIVTMEAMGIPIATALSEKMNIPFTIIRKRSYGLPGEVSVEQVTGYSNSKLFINGLKKDDTVVIVDDVLSTGGTINAVLSALQKIGVVVKGVFIAIDKGNVAPAIEKEYGIKIHTLVDIEVVDGKVIFKR
ncbi:MAG: hypoxanthine/guanine phosphoribosyltransferase [Euryarchaeota archaeon]|nr:hypoxanthine/guanine phosphoribosyltransferase [Euryarchaeota archaeon]